MMLILAKQKHDKKSIKQTDNAVNDETPQHNLEAGATIALTNNDQYDDRPDNHDIESGVMAPDTSADDGTREVNDFVGLEQREASDTQSNAPADNAEDEKETALMPEEASQSMISQHQAESSGANFQAESSNGHEIRELRDELPSKNSDDRYVITEL